MGLEEKSGDFITIHLEAAQIFQSGLKIIQLNCPQMKWDRVTVSHANSAGLWCWYNSVVSCLPATEYPEITDNKVHRFTASGLHLQNGYFHVQNSPWWDEDAPIISKTEKYYSCYTTTTLHSLEISTLGLYEWNFFSAWRLIMSGTLLNLDLSFF